MLQQSAGSHWVLAWFATLRLCIDLTERYVARLLVSTSRQELMVHTNLKVMSQRLSAEATPPALAVLARPFLLVWRQSDRQRGFEARTHAVKLLLHCMLHVRLLRIWARPSVW